LQRVGGSLDAEGALELGEHGVTGRGVRGAPGVPEDAPDDPVGAGDQPVDGRVVRVDEQVGEPAAVAAEGERVAVEEDDAGDVLRIGEPGGGRDTCSERVADEDRLPDVEAPLEAVQEL